MKKITIEELKEFISDIGYSGILYAVGKISKIAYDYDLSDYVSHDYDDDLCDVVDYINNRGEEVYGDEWDKQLFVDYASMIF